MSTDTTTSDYTTGDLLGGRFEITALLGRGGFGETYAARDTAGGGDVAVKVLLLQRLKDWKALELFEREARVLESLDHPRVPDYVDFIQDEASGRAYLVQELAPGRPLGALLSEGRRFDQAEAIAIAEQVLEVLVYLQSLRRPPLRRMGSNVAPPSTFWSYVFVFAILVPLGATALLTLLYRSAQTPGIAAAILALGIVAGATYFFAPLTAYFILELPLPRRITLEVQGLQFRLRRLLLPTLSGRLSELAIELEDPKEDKRLGRIRFSTTKGFPAEGAHITAEEIDEIAAFLTENDLPFRRT